MSLHAFSILLIWVLPLNHHLPRNPWACGVQGWVPARRAQLAWWGASRELVGAAHVAAQHSHLQAPSQHSHTAKAQIFCCQSSAAQVMIFHDILMLAGAAVSGFTLAEEHVLLQVGNGKGFCQQKIHLHSNVPANSY